MQKTASLQQSVSPETVWVAGICLLDLATTLYWISQGHAREGNPLMAWVLGHGHVAFIASKVVTFLPALMILEWYRNRKPVLVRRVLRLAIAGYVCIWVAGTLPALVLHVAPRLFLMLAP